MNKSKYLWDLLNVFGYNHGNGMERLKEMVSNMYGNRQTYITLNGRTAIVLFLKSLDLKEGDKVAVQAFTCNAVINPILSLGLTPVYIDIEGFNMSLEDLKRKDKGDIKVAIIQHNFGIECNTGIFEYCKQRGIYVLEDCAHTLGNSAIGNKGDAMMLSFGIEKMLSTRVGGALVLNNMQLQESIDVSYSNVRTISNTQTFLWMLNPILWRVIRAFPFLKGLFKFLGVLKSGFERGEGSGNVNYLPIQAISSVLANQINDCLSSLDSNISHRKLISDIYKGNVMQQYDSLIRYPYTAKDALTAEKIISYLNQEGYPSDDRWFEPVIFPRNTDLKAMRYELGSCPKAEDLSSRIVNLPTGTNIDENKALEISKNILKIEQLS